ncbi:transferase [Streptomyces sp. NPDC052496]|uniref:transferase n=1 Tax=Streptomyces sp. NPDC052496 TaxID=3154951 RepID=UPI00343BB3E8
MPTGERTSARLVTSAAVVAAYVALHLAVTAAMDRQAYDRFRDAPAQAAAFTAAVEYYAAGDASARAQIRRSAAWFDQNVPAGESRLLVSASARDALEGRFPPARERVAGLAADVERERAGLSRERGSSDAAALYGAAAAVVLCVPALWLRRRRRAGAAAIIEVVGRFAPRRPWWRRPVFLAADGLGYGLFAGGFLVAGAAQRKGTALSPPAFVLLLIGGLAALGAGVVILRWARPRSARGAVQALLADGREPVLYLRSFADDDAAAQVDDAGSYISLHSREEQLAGALGAVGPVITVGRPGEPLPRLGAARFYLPLDDWQPTVLRLMELSQLIVLRLGPGEGLWWELGQARATQPAHKLVLLAPCGPREAAERLDEHLPVPSRLDEVVGSDVWTSAVITFAPDWTPHVHPVGPAPRATSRRNALVRRAVSFWRAVVAATTEFTPAHYLARALKAAMAAVGVRRRTMTVRTVLATQKSLWKGMALVTALGLLAWPAVRTLQLFGIR